MTDTQQPDDSISADAILFIEVNERVYRYRLVKAVTSVGSDEDNVVRIRDESVASHHLLMTYVDGGFFLRRIGDSSVQLNGDPVENYSEELRYGDVLSIGDVKLRLVQGGDTSDTAVMLLMYPHMEEEVRPWHVFLSRRTNITLGEPPADLLLQGSGRTTIENYGPGSQYAIPPKEGGDKLQLNDETVTRRVRLKDKDVLGLPDCTVKLRFLRGEVMDDAETLLWPEVMRRFSITGDE